MSSSQGTVKRSAEDKGTGDNSLEDHPHQHVTLPPPSSLIPSPDSKMESAPEPNPASPAGNQPIRQSSSRHHSDRYFSRDRIHSSSSASSSTSHPQHPPPPPPPHHHHPYYRHDPHIMQSSPYSYPPPPHHYSREHHPYPYDAYSRGAPPPHEYRHPHPPHEYHRPHPSHGYGHPSSVRSPPFPQDGASSFHQPPPPPPPHPLSSSSSSKAGPPRQQAQPIPTPHSQSQQQQAFARRYSRNGAGPNDHYTSQSSSSPSPHGTAFPSSQPYPNTHGHPPYGSASSSLPLAPSTSSRNTKMMPSPPPCNYPSQQGPSPPLGPSSSFKRKVKIESVSGMPTPCPTETPAPYAPPRPCPPPLSENDPASRAKIVIVQQPLHARMCGFGEKDRRPIDPPPIVQLFMDDNPHYNELKLPVKLKMPAPSKKGRAAAARKAAAAAAAAAAEAAAAEEAAAQAREARREERRAAKMLEKQQRISSSSSSSTLKKSAPHPPHHQYHHHQGREMKEGLGHRSGGLVRARSGIDEEREHEGRWGGESGNEGEDGTYELDEDEDMGEGSDDRQRDRRRSSNSSAGLRKHRTSTGSIKEEINGNTNTPSGHPHPPFLSQAGKKHPRTSEEGEDMDSGRDGSDDASRHSQEDDDHHEYSESESESTDNDSGSDDNGHSLSKDATKRRERKPIMPVLPPTVPGQPPIPIQYPRYPGGRAALAIDPLFVLHASLWSEDGKEVRSMISTPGQTDPPKLTRILMGAVVVSPILLNNEKGVPGWYFSFPDLSIRTEGSYRLKFSLMRFASFDFDDRGGTHASHIVAEVTSEPFTVFSAKKFPGMTESTELSKAFAKQGLKIPIRNDLRPRKNNDKDD